jgi:Phosphotransferase enzyme family
MHRYIQARGFLVNLEQSPINLARVLWQRGSGLGFEDRLHHPQLRFIPPDFLKTYRIARLVLTLAAYPWGVSKQQVIPLAGYGQLGLALRLGGYKLFDLPQAKVLTLFAEGLEQHVINVQIAKAQHAGQHAFAPKVSAANTAERWYEESYFTGHRLPPLLLELTLLQTHFFPLFIALIRAEPVQTLDLQEYATTLQTFALGGERGLAHPTLNTVLNADQTKLVQTFIKETAMKLQQEGKAHLVLSHGDLHEQNVLATAQGFKLIDWNNLGHRSLGYDLYTLLFRSFRPIRPFWSARFPEPEPNAIETAVEQFRRTLIPEFPVFAEALATPAYRQLFYLEFLCKGIEKFWENTTPEALQARLEHLAAWTSTFVRYEAEHPHP